MKKLLMALAALAMALPVLGTAEPAQALTAHQYQELGRGHYVSSTKRVGGMRMRHHRLYRHRHMHRR